LNGKFDVRRSVYPSAYNELIFILKFIPKPILFLYNRILIFYVFPFFLELFFVI